MSGFLKSVGKVFKKIVKSPIFKVVAIAAAVYFTGGLALTAMGGEAAIFAASMPGISSAASALGIGAVADAAGTAAGTAAWVSGEALVDAGLTASQLGTLAAEVPTLAGTAGDSLIGTAMDYAGTANKVKSGFDTASALTQSTAGDDSFANAAQTPDLTVPDLTRDFTNTGVSGGLNKASPVTGAAFDASAEATADSGLSTNAIKALAGPQATSPTVASNLQKWYADLNSTEKKLLGSSIAGLGKGALSALSVKSQQDFQQALADRARDDVTRKSGVPNITGAFSYAKGPGLINSVTQGPIKVGG